MAKSGNLEETTSQDGHSYLHRPAPDNVELDYVESSDEIILSDVDAYPVYHLYIKCNEIRDKGLPLNADPRRPDDSDQVTAMVETLEKEPNEFIKRNNGIVLLCNNVILNEGRAKIEFKQREGICNGGHTYFSFYRAEEVPDEAVVHLETIVLGDENFSTEQDRRRKITDIARARNNNNQLERRSIADFLGFFDHYRNALIDSKMVAWNEGDRQAYSDSIDSVDFMRLMKSLDPDDFRHPIYNQEGRNHRTLATSRGKILRNWADQVEESRKDPTQNPPLYYLVPVSNDMLYIRDMVSYKLCNCDWGQTITGTNFYREYLDKGSRTVHFDDYKNQEGFDLPATLEVLFMGLFRSNLYLSQPPNYDPKYVGWFISFDELWERQGRGIIKEMADTYTNVDSDAKQFIRLNGPFSLDFYKQMVGQKPPDPNHIYDISLTAEEAASGGVYVQDEGGSHWLSRAEGESNSDELVSIKDKEPKGDPSFYMEVSMNDLHSYKHPEQVDNTV
jgi:hypothetical protein